MGILDATLPSDFIHWCLASEVLTFWGERGAGQDRPKPRPASARERRQMVYASDRTMHPRQRTPATSTVRPFATAGPSRFDQRLEKAPLGRPIEQ